MIKKIKFNNFRNISNEYYMHNSVSVIVGKNNSGKTNLLDGIRLAFSVITQDYCKIEKSDFLNSDDNNTIEITVELEYDSIPTLNIEEKCGYILSISKTSKKGYYKRKIKYLNGNGPVDLDILHDDCKVPNVHSIPLLRIEDIYSKSFTTGMSNFISSEEEYMMLKNKSKSEIKERLKDKINEFKLLCGAFNENLDVELSDPKISDEKLYIVDGELEHSYRIGSGYKSVANIMLNTMDSEYSIVLIDEIENHLHPALIRVLIRKLKNVKNTQVICTTHSSVAISEFSVSEIIDISGYQIKDIGTANIAKLDTFLHPGRNEMIMGDNIVLVEGYTEEILLRNYLNSNNHNLTVVNVAGVMFEPYIELCSVLKKKVVVVSDNDIALSDDKSTSSRFESLKRLCVKKGIKIIEIDNTLETDLLNSGFINEGALKKHMQESTKHSDIMVAKKKHKTQISQDLIMSKCDLTQWHVIKGILEEFELDSSSNEG